jgi:hypothetical protein
MRISIILYVGTAVGLVFGGYGAGNYDRHLLFLLNLPGAVVSICLLLRHFLRVPPPADPRVTGIDKICIGLLAVVLFRYRCCRAAARPMTGSDHRCGSPHLCAGTARGRYG